MCKGEITMEAEIWKAHPEYAGIEVSTFGNVRTLDRLVSSEKYTRFTKGRVLKQSSDKDGYLQVRILIDGKWTTKKVHRLVAQAFIQNHDNLPQVNHKNCVRDDNRVSNLEWCTPSYNSRYREKHGVSQIEAAGHPLFSINLDTLEKLHFRAQAEAGRSLGIGVGNINNVIKGKIKQAGGYYFKEDDGNGVEIDKDKLNDILDGMRFTGGVFAVNLYTLEVSRFNSQNEASRALGVKQGSISNVIKGKGNQAGGFWFVKDDGHAVDVVKSKLHDVGGVGLNIKYRKTLKTR